MALAGRPNVLFLVRAFAGLTVTEFLSTRHVEEDTGPFTGSAADLQSSSDELGPLMHAEKPQFACSGQLSEVAGRVEAGAVVGDLEVDLIGLEPQLHHRRSS